MWSFGVVSVSRKSKTPDRVSRRNGLATGFTCPSQHRNGIDHERGPDHRKRDQLGLPEGFVKNKNRDQKDQGRGDVLQDADGRKAQAFCAVGVDDQRNRADRSGPQQQPRVPCGFRQKMAFAADDQIGDIGQRKRRQQQDFQGEGLIWANRQ